MRNWSPAKGQTCFSAEVVVTGEVEEACSLARGRHQQRRHLRRRQWEAVPLKLRRHLPCWQPARAKMSSYWEK